MFFWNTGIYALFPLLARENAHKYRLQYLDKFRQQKLRQNIRPGKKKHSGERCYRGEKKRRETNRAVLKFTKRGGTKKCGMGARGAIMPARQAPRAIWRLYRPAQCQRRQWEFQ
ncbi:hypothetical protein LJC48_01955, partial [Desulfovibrio sp. OttesenSCG-928-C06]|nr:hypothetical protein [Desulfovibrio sp. OttesenSCG-928-C06]